MEKQPCIRECDPALSIKIESVKNYTFIVGSAMLSQCVMQGNQKATMTKWVGWTPPQHGWVTLNTDGYAKNGSNLVGGGGLLRDHAGRWIEGFPINLRSCSTLEVELWVIIHGLHIAWRKGIRSLMVETDSTLAYSWISRDRRDSNKHLNNLQKCAQLLQQD